MSHLFDDQYDDTSGYERFITTIQQRAGIAWRDLARRGEGRTPRAVDDRPGQSERQQAERGSPPEILPVLAFERARKACGVRRRQGRR
jgi:hypothetical protein